MRIDTVRVKNASKIKAQAEATNCGLRSGSPNACSTNS
jgi:hypothetical protein